MSLWGGLQKDVNDKPQVTKIIYSLKTWYCLIKSCLIPLNSSFLKNICKALNLCKAYSIYIININLLNSHSNSKNQILLLDSFHRGGKVQQWKLTYLLKVISHSANKMRTQISNPGTLAPILHSWFLLETSCLSAHGKQVSISCK